MLVHCDSFQLIASAVLFYAYPLHLSSTLGLCFTLLIKSMPLRLVSRPVPTVLALIRSARFLDLDALCLRITFLGYAYALPNVALPFHFCATPGNSIPLPNLTFPLQCISFLFHRLSRLINTITNQCVAFPFLCQT